MLQYVGDQCGARSGSLQLWSIQVDMYKCIAAPPQSTLILVSVVIAGQGPCFPGKHPLSAILGLSS